MLKLLLQAGADPNPSKVQRSPLAVALWTKQMRLFEELKSAGAKFNMEGYDAPLLEAARFNRLDIIDAILKSGVGPDDMNDGHGYTALWQAISDDKSEVVKMLLKAGAKYDLSQQPSQGSSVNWAWRIATSKPDIMKQFLDAGLAVNASVMDRYSKSTTLLHWAAENGDPSGIALLISHGAAVNAQDENNGDTPLMLAAQNGRTENVKALLAAKADFSLMNNWGKTAKVTAATADKNDIVQLLTAAGADEYSGSHIPLLSRYAPELIGKDQNDISGNVHKALPFLPKNLRFFVAHDHINPAVDTIGPVEIHGRIYAVFPSEQVIKLDKPSAFVELKFSIAKPQDALSLAKVYSDPGAAIAWGDIMPMEGIAFHEFPTAGNCLSITPDPSTFGIAPPVVSTNGEGNQKTYRITRFGLRHSQNSINSNWVSKQNTETPQVVKVEETIKANGEYSNHLTDVPSPGLAIKVTCFPR